MQFVSGKSISIYLQLWFLIIFSARPPYPPPISQTYLIFELLKIYFSKSKRYISFGLGTGLSNYFGDLAPRSTRTSTDLGYSRSYLTFFYLQRVHPNVTIRTSLSWMRLRGDDFSVSDISIPSPSDLGRFKRNLSFRTDIFEMSSVGLFELFPTDRGYLRRNFVNPYGLIGLSVFHHNPETKTPTVT